VRSYELSALLTPEREAAYLAHRHCGLRLDGAGGVVYMRGAAAEVKPAAPIEVEFYPLTTLSSGGGSSSSSARVRRVELPIPFRLPPQRFVVQPSTADQQRQMKGLSSTSKPLVDMSAPYTPCAALLPFRAASLCRVVQRLSQLLEAVEDAGLLPADSSIHLKHQVFEVMELLLAALLQPSQGVEGELRSRLGEQLERVAAQLSVLRPIAAEAEGAGAQEGGPNPFLFGDERDYVTDDAEMQAVMEDSLVTYSWQQRRQQQQPTAREQICIDLTDD